MCDPCEKGAFDPRVENCYFRCLCVSRTHLVSDEGTGSSLGKGTSERTERHFLLLPTTCLGWVNCLTTRLKFLTSEFSVQVVLQVCMGERGMPENTILKAKVVCVCVVFYFSFWWHWELNPGPNACWAGALPLSSINQLYLNF